MSVMAHIAFDEEKTACSGQLSEQTEQHLGDAAGSTIPAADDAAKPQPPGVNRQDTLPVSHRTGDPGSSRALRLGKRPQRGTFLSWPRRLSV
jgi:hypothetical protein